MTIHIRDSGESGERCKRLMKLLRDRNVSVQFWPGEGGLAISAKDVALGHSYEVSREGLKKLVSSGGLAIHYTAGTTWEREERSGAGWVYVRQLNSVETALASLRATSTLDDLKAALDYPERQRLFVSLLVLTRIATTELNDRQTQARQRTWREDRKKWHHVFSKVSKEDFLAAADPTSFCKGAWPDDLIDTGKLVDWIFAQPSKDKLPTSAAAADVHLERARNELEKLF